MKQVKKKDWTKFGKGIGKTIGEGVSSLKEGYNTVTSEKTNKFFVNANQNLKKGLPLPYNERFNAAREELVNYYEDVKSKGINPRSGFIEYLSKKYQFPINVITGMHNEYATGTYEESTSPSRAEVIMRQRNEYPKLRQSQPRQIRQPSYDPFAAISSGNTSSNYMDALNLL